MGGSYVNGKALPESVRKQIIEMSLNNIRACDIAKQLKVSHGCVSKLLKKYRNTGSYKAGSTGGSKPKVAVPEVVDIIMRYKEENPTMFSWEIRDRLIKERRCTKLNVPSISSINRIIRSKTSESTRRSSLGSSCSPSSSENSISPPISANKRSPFGYSINDILGQQSTSENLNLTSTPILPQSGKRKFSEIDDGDLLAVAAKSARLIEEEVTLKAASPAPTANCTLPSVRTPCATDLCKDLGSLLDMLPWVPSQVSSLKNNSNFDDSFTSLVGPGKGPVLHESQATSTNRGRYQNENVTPYQQAGEIQQNSLPNPSLSHYHPQESCYPQQKPHPVVPRPVQSVMTSSGPVPNTTAAPAFSTSFSSLPPCSQTLTTGLSPYSYPSYPPPAFTHMPHQKHVYPAVSLSSGLQTPNYQYHAPSYNGYTSTALPYYY